MKRIAAAGTLLSLTLALTLQVNSQFIPPSLKNKIEPNTDPQLKSSPIDPMTVRIGIDETGIPDEILDSTGLPDAVVRAIAKAEFNPAMNGGKPVAVSVRLVVPMHRELEYFRSIRDRPSSDDFDSVRNL